MACVCLTVLMDRSVYTVTHTHTVQYYSQQSQDSNYFPFPFFFQSQNQCLDLDKIKATYRTSQRDWECGSWSSSSPVYPTPSHPEHIFYQPGSPSPEKRSRFYFEEWLRAEKIQKKKRRHDTDLGQFLSSEVERHGFCVARVVDFDVNLVIIFVLSDQSSLQTGHFVLFPVDQDLGRKHAEVRSSDSFMWTAKYDRDILVFTTCGGLSALMNSLVCW